MVITCINCYKKFDIDSNLISDKGRLLQCARCDHKWFFKKEVLDKTVSPIVENIDSDTINVFDHNNSSNNYEINPSDLTRDEVVVDTEEKLDEKIEVNNEKEPEKKIDDNINESTSVNTKPKKQRKDGKNNKPNATNGEKVNPSIPPNVGFVTGEILLFRVLFGI